MQGRQDDPRQAADLIGYHLGLCEKHEAAAVEQAVGKGPQLEKACCTVGSILKRLEADVIPEPPTHLNQIILQKIANAGRTLPFKPLTPAADVGPARSSFNLRELMSLAAVIAIFVGVFVPGYNTARHNSQIAICANNLRQIGTATEMYRQAYGTPLPYVAAMADGTSWVRSDLVDGGHVNNSQNAFQLVRQRYVSPNAFNCPGRENDVPLSCQNPNAFMDFPDSRNNSYTQQIVTGPLQFRQFEPESPIAADLTPLVDGQRRLIQDQPVSLNSLSHGGVGQNVLKANMRVIWTRNPNAGLDNDDIYRVIGVQKYTGMERPQLRSDAFLVP